LTRASGQDLTVVILAFNESLHIERCIRSARRIADDILVVDSHSTDDTRDRAKRLGARVLQNPWINYATQMNWSLAHGDIGSAWVMRLDADEVIGENLSNCIKPAMNDAGADVGAFEVNCLTHFLGRPIRYGGLAPMWLLRIWRNGWARCETRWMDEHVVLSQGRISRLPGVLLHDNVKSVSWWVHKHNSYASREAVDVLDQRHHLHLADRSSTGLNRQARTKRWLKTRVYARLPLGIRPWLFYFYRMVLRLGVLDGMRGMMFHTLHGLWYRLLVDAKVLEVEDAMKRERCDVAEAIHRVLGIDIRTVSITSSEQSPN
jgi:glycosyltransferase involved in cell wall biosynthesis